jgi:hypothetical protein
VLSYAGNLPVADYIAPIRKDSSVTDDIWHVIHELPIRGKEPLVNDWFIIYNQDKTFSKIIEDAILEVEDENLLLENVGTFIFVTP